jgi:hypothetical protein
MACSWGSVIPPYLNSMKVSFHGKVSYCGSPMNDITVEDPFEDQSTDDSGDLSDAQWTKDSGNLSDDPGPEAIVEGCVKDVPIPGTDLRLDRLCLLPVSEAAAASAAMVASWSLRRDGEQVHRMIEAMSNTRVQ